MSSDDADRLAELEREVERLRQWVNDLQSGMYINCVYCGHRYGPDDEVPATMADALKEHIERCPEHPMSALRAQRDRLAEALRECLTREGAKGDLDFARAALASLDEEPKP